MDNKYQAFAEEIFRMTKENELRWKYLDTFEDLYESMGWTKSKYITTGMLGMKEVFRPGFDTNNSFFATIQGTHIVLCVENQSPASLYVIPNTYKNVIKLKSDEFGEIITRLFNYVQSQFPTAKGFIDDFMSNTVEKE